MDVFGWDRDGTEDYDLLILNFYVLLDSLRGRNKVLHRRVLDHWRKFQTLRADFPDWAYE